MNILLLGYGKMGQAIEKIALERGHIIKYKVSKDDLLNESIAIDIDVAIEFSQPNAAFTNIKFCLNQGIPVVSGTTGWLEKYPEIERHCKKVEGTFFYASNFSLGVNLFFKLNEFLAKLMNTQSSYDVKMKEVHHTEKKDAPSGTAITLAEGIIEEVARKKYWSNDATGQKEILEICSERIDKVPGTHVVSYCSEIDDIEIKHVAHSRKGFAMGAVLVAEWIITKKGTLKMDDFLRL